MKKKISIGFFSLTSCEGCYFSVLEQLGDLLALNDKIEIKNFRLIADEEHFPPEKFDIAFIEGSPLTKKNMENLLKIRLASKIVVATGSCAHIGGIYHMKNYQDKEKLFDHIYNDVTGIENYDVLPIGKVIPVDFNLPGCPVTADEFFSFVHQMLIGKKPHITEKPVCCECQIRGYECVLQNGGKCLGPATYAGCGAICLKSKQGCWGCRGFYSDAENTNLMKKLKEKYSEKEIIKLLEVFGVKEDLK
jgi:sulfhydrogenase subunit delta